MEIDMHTFLKMTNRKLVRRGSKDLTMIESCSKVTIFYVQGKEVLKKYLKKRDENRL